MKNPIRFFFSREEDDVKVANNRLLSYAMGLAGQNANYGFVSNRLFVFLNTVLKIDSRKTGLITGFSTLWDAINDPIIGTLVDARKFKPGNKLRPFLLYLPPIIGVLTALMFFDFGFSEGQTVAFIVVVYLLYDIVYSYQDVALWGMLPLSSPNSDERGRVSQWATIGAGAGSTIASLFPQVRQSIVDLGIASEKTAYFIGAVGFGFGGMLVSMLAYRMREKVVYTHPDEKNGVLKNLAALRYNRTLLIICLARFVACFSLTLPWEYFFETQGVSYTVFGMEFSGATVQLLYSFIPGIPGAFAMLFATKFAKRIGGMKRILVIAEVLSVSIRTICFFLGANDRFLNFWVLVVIMLLVSIINIPTNMKDIAHRALISDSIDEVELKTGERTEGIAYSMQNFISKLTGAASKFIQGYLLRWLGFNEKITDSAGRILEGTAAIRAHDATSRLVKYRWHQFMLGPAIGSALYLIVILFLKDDRARAREVEQKLREKRAAMEHAAEPHEAEAPTSVG